MTNTCEGAGQSIAYAYLRGGSKEVKECVLQLLCEMMNTFGQEEHSVYPCGDLKGERYSEWADPVVQELTNCMDEYEPNKVGWVISSIDAAKVKRVAELMTQDNQTFATIQAEVDLDIRDLAGVISYNLSTSGLFKGFDSKWRTKWHNEVFGKGDSSVKSGEVVGEVSPEGEQQEVFECEYCGGTLSKGDAFCRTCGRPLNWGD